MFRRFKAWCQSHEVSVGTFMGILGFVVSTATVITETTAGYDLTGLPSWAVAGFGALTWFTTQVGRYGQAIVKARNLWNVSMTQGIEGHETDVPPTLPSTAPITTAVNSVIPDGDAAATEQMSADAGDDIDLTVVPDELP